MKCLHCDNELPNKRGWASDKNPKGKKACMMEGCISFGLNFRTSLFRQLVMGLSEDEVRRAAKSKAKKGVVTQRFKGFYDDPSNNPFSKDYWIKKGLTDIEAKAKIASRIHNTKEFWISRGFNIDQAIELAKTSADTNSLHAKITKYGLDIGIEKYRQTCSLMSKNHNHASSSTSLRRSSNAANKFFVQVYKWCRRNGYTRDDIYWEPNRGEFWLRDESKIYFYDFVIKPLKLIIEYNGEHVHPNTNVLSAEQLQEWKHAYSEESADEVLARELKKESTAKENGYTIIHVWSTNEQFSILIEEIKWHKSKS